MKQQMHRSIVAAAIALMSIGSLHAQTSTGNIVVDTQQSAAVPYLLDSQRIIVRNSTGQCWRTGFWTAELAAQTRVVGSPFPAGCACDEPLMPAGTCTPPPVAVAPTPVPAPAPAPVPTSEKVTIPTDTLFEFDRATLTPAGQDKLTAFSDQLKTLNLEAVVAVGHTDRIGSTQYNQALSERRAAAVKEFLVSKGGVEASRVFIEGRGESQPTTGEQCKSGKGAETGRNRGLVQCLAPDRRVDIEAVGTRR
ncbi:MAG: OmpA family protein [Rubrivivax sp.]|nr:MAG: OmpA family protein [Rubrivivax sp.]